MHRFFDKDIELKAMLSMLASSDNIRLKILNHIKLDHFGYSTVQQIYQVLLDVMTKSTALPTIETFCRTPGLPENTIELLVTQDAVTNDDDATHLIDILSYYRRIRKLAEFQANTANAMSALDDTEALDIDSIMGDMEKTMLDMRSSSVEEAKMFHLGSGFNSPELYNNILNVERSNLIPSTFNNFDKIVKGFGPNDLLFLASHAKGGKSIVALNMCIRMYLRHNKDVCFITLEMPPEEIADRLFSHISGVKYSKIRQRICTPPELKTIQVAYNSFIEHGRKNNCRFTIQSPVDFTIRDLRLKIKPMRYNIICLDYINLLSGLPEKMAKWEKLDEWSRELKKLTIEMNAFFIVPAQMNADGDIRYSKALKEHATNIWTWFYGEGEKTSGCIEVNQLVTRGWGFFPFKLAPDFDFMKIEDYDEGTVKERFNESYDDETGEFFD